MNTSATVTFSVLCYRACLFLSITPPSACPVWLIIGQYLTQRHQPITKVLADHYACP